MILPGKLDTLQSGALQGQVPEALTPSPGDTHAGTPRPRTDIAGHGGEGRQAEGGPGIQDAQPPVRPTGPFEQGRVLTPLPEIFPP